MTLSGPINELASALAKAQSQFKPVVYDSENPHFKSKFASLTAIVDAIREPLSANGLSFIQSVWTNPEGKTVLTTCLLHASGQWVSSDFQLLIEKQSMQGVGSAITYAKRYSLSALVGVVSESDDDGEGLRSLEPLPRKPVPIKNDSVFIPRLNEPTTVTKLVYEKEKVKSLIRKLPPPERLVADFVCPIGNEVKGKALKDIPIQTLEGIKSYLGLKELRSDVEQTTLTQITEYLLSIKRMLLENELPRK